MALLLQGALEGQEVLSWGVEEQEEQEERVEQEGRQVQQEVRVRPEGPMRRLFLGPFAPAPASVVPAVFGFPALEQMVHFVLGLWVQQEPPEHEPWL